MLIRRVVVAAISASVLVVPVSIASADGVGTSSVPAVGSASAAEQADLAAIAAAKGIGLSEAASRFGWQNDFAVAATAVEEAHPDTFAGSEITSTTPAVATIRFKGAVPADVDGMLSGLPHGVRVRLVGDEKLSAREIDTTIIAAHQAVVATGEVDTVISTFDRDSGSVQVAASPRHVEGRSSAPAATELSQRARALESQLPASVGRVQVTLDPGVASGAEARYGGGRLERSGEAGLSCTAGFSVRNSAGTTGVATAGHCPNGLTHENTNGGAEYSVTYRNQHRGAWGDFQWGTTSDTEPDDFYSSSSARRDVTGRANPSDGQTICRFGHRTGAHCNTVEDTSLCVTFDDIETCRLVRMDTDEADGGDSGGPWYYGNTAYGFHTGETSCHFFWRDICDVWSRVTYIDDAMSVTVRTS